VGDLDCVQECAARLAAEGTQFGERGAQQVTMREDPGQLPPCTTGMWRTCPSVMISSTVDSLSVTLTVTIFVCMMSRTRAAALISTTQ
jgi:hypothetical protein